MKNRLYNTAIALSLGAMSLYSVPAYAGPLKSLGKAIATPIVSTIEIVATPLTTLEKVVDKDWKGAAKELNIAGKAVDTTVNTVEQASYIPRTKDSGYAPDENGKGVNYIREEHPVIGVILDIGAGATIGAGISNATQGSAVDIGQTAVWSAAGQTGLEAITYEKK